MTVQESTIGIYQSKTQFNKNLSPFQERVELFNISQPVVCVPIWGM